MWLLLKAYWKPLLAILGMVGLFTTGYYKGYSGEHERFQEYKLSEQARKEVVVQETKAISTQTAAETRVQQDKVKTVFKEITKYVPIPQSSNCRVPNGFVSLWNESSSMQIPNTPTGFDPTISTVTLSDTLKQHTADAEQYYTMKAQCEGLIKWTKEVGAIE